MSNNDLSATIANMMEVLNPTRTRRKSDLRTSIDYESPLKRRLSSDSYDNTPDKRERTESALDISWISSPRESRRLRAEIVDARTHISNLEHRIQYMHGVRKKLQVMFDNESKMLHSQHERDLKTIDQLEQQMQSIRKREKEVRDELDNLKGKQNTSKLEQEAHIEELESTITELQAQLKLYEADEQDQLSQLRSQIAELEMVRDAARQDANAHKKLASDLEARLNEITANDRDYEIKDQNLQTAHLKIKELEYKLEMYTEFKEQSKIQQQKLSSYSNLEKEIAKLREDKKNLTDEVQNKLILEEQNYDLNKKVEILQKQEEQFTALQVSHAQLESLVAEWRCIAEGLFDVNCEEKVLPRQVRQYIEKLQEQEITFMSEKVQLESQIKNFQHEAKLAKLELEKSMKQVSDRQSVLLYVPKLQKKLLLVSKERDSYRAQLDSYEKDLTISIPQGQTALQAQFNTQKERIESLEEVIEGYREMVANLEKDLKESQPHLNIESMVPVRKEQTARLQEEIERLQNENSRLTERCDTLEIRLEQELVGKDVVRERVVHFKENPLSKCLATEEANVEKLQDEVDRLKRKIRNMEEGLESSKLSDSVCSSREVQTLREQVKSSEIKMQRLKDYFKSSSHEFRNVCYMLLGYKIDRLVNNQYKLSSMYAEAPDDHLSFELNAEGNLNLLETNYSSTLEDMVDLHLRHQSSIPVFLSAITMDLFNRTTMATKTFVE